MAVMPGDLGEEIQQGMAALSLAEKRKRQSRARPTSRTATRTPYALADFTDWVPISQPGAQGQVYRAMNRRVRPARPVIVKRVPRRPLPSLPRQQQDTIRQQFAREVAVMRQLEHLCTAYTTCLETSFASPEYLYLVMTLLDKYMDLFDFIRAGDNQRLTVAQLESIFRHLIMALRLIHHSGVAHRDLKPENVMIGYDTPNKNTRIIDFGGACIEQECWGLESLVSAVTTLDYLPPELWPFYPHVFEPTAEPEGQAPRESRKSAYATARGLPRTPDASQFDRTLSGWQKVDIWQLGLTLWVLLTGEDPDRAFELPADKMSLVRRNRRDFYDQAPQFIEALGVMLSDWPGNRYLPDLTQAQLDMP